MEPSRKGRERRVGARGCGCGDEGDHQNFFSPERLLAAAAVWDSPILKRRFRRAAEGLEMEVARIARRWIEMLPREDCVSVSLGEGGVPQPISYVPN